VTNTHFHFIRHNDIRAYLAARPDPMDVASYIIEFAVGFEEDWTSRHEVRGSETKAFDLMEAEFGMIRSMTDKMVCSRILVNGQEVPNSYREF
jgi:hypothetical protein